ncbi:MAG: hypothetical protein GEV09_04405 [Pseudonocardiaceae bacterium]|nr:hypothetical protein [Pseudonocardiaceae bacterium]
MISAAGIPTIDGDMDALAAHARAIGDVGSAFADTGQRVHATWQGLAAVYEAPEVGALLAATGPVQHLSASVGADIETVGGVLGSYAAEVREIKTRLEALRGQAGAFEASVEGDDDWADDDASVERNNELVGAVNAAVADFYAAQRRAANAINALYGGTQYRASDGDGRREPGEYGYSAEQLGAAAGEDGALPWGSTTEGDRGLLGDVGAFFVGIKDGAVAMVGDLGALIGRNPATGEWSWGMAGTAWAGVGKFALAATMAANNPGMVASGRSRAVPGIFDEGEASTLLREAGKSFIAYDQWGEDNARAAGHATFNVVAAIVGTKGAGAALKTTGTAAAGSRVAAVSRAGTAMVRGGETIGRLPTVDDVAAGAARRLPGFRVPDIGAGTTVDVPTNHHVDVPSGQIDTPSVGSTPDAAPTPGSVGDALAHTPDSHTASPAAPDTGSTHHTDVPDQRATDTAPTSIHPDTDAPTSPASSDRTPDSSPGRPDNGDATSTPDGRPTDTPQGDRTAETTPPDNTPDPDRAPDPDRLPDADSTPGGDPTPDADQIAVDTTPDTDQASERVDADGAHSAEAPGHEQPGSESTPGDQALGTQPDGSWVNVEHGTRFDLTPEQNAVADRYLSGARADEVQISPQVTGVTGHIDGARTQGYPDYVVKGEDSFKRKFAGDLEKYPDLTEDQVVANIKDSVRYTIEVPQHNYTDGVLQGVNDLRSRGYENVTFKPTWDNPDTYKGVNSTWRDPATGRVFELQFHTPDSFNAKMATHDLYESERVVTTDLERQRAADAQAEIFRQVDVPDGAVERLDELKQEFDAERPAAALPDAVEEGPEATSGGDPDKAFDDGSPADPGDAQAVTEPGEAPDWSDIADATDVNSEPAAHAETATAKQAHEYIAEHHPYVFDTNVERLREKVPGTLTNCSRCAASIDNGFATGGLSSAPPWPGGPTGWGVEGADMADYARMLGADTSDYRAASSYDEVIVDIGSRGEGAHGIVYISRPWDNSAHVFNVVHDAEGVVFLDGQTGGLARLEKNVRILYLPIGK